MTKRLWGGNDGLLTVRMEEEDNYSYAGWAQVAPNTNTGSFDTIPAIKYRSSGSIEIRLKDNKGWYWTRRLPETASYKTLKTNASEYTLQAYQENLGIKPSSIAFPVQEILFNASGSVGSTAVLYLSCIGDIEHYPYGTNVKNVIIEILDSRAQNMSFYYLRPFPLEEYQYAGSIATFSMSTMYNVVDTWRGTPYVGYQAPYFWLDCAEKEKLQTNLMFMGAAQDEYERRTGNSGFFAPVFIWDRWDSREYGTPNTFSWKGPDPNTNWGGFQYRAVEAAARTWYQAPDFPSAKRITMKFLSAVNSRWRSGTDPIFTTFNEDGTIHHMVTSHK